jgi:hypothetical protein
MGIPFDSAASDAAEDDVWSIFHRLDNYGTVSAGTPQA